MALNSSVYMLKSFEEAVGNLSKIEVSDGIFTATIGGICVAVPEGIATKLKPFIGKRVGLLRTDKDFRTKTSENIQ